MPAAKHLAFLRETVRNHPVVVATTAATAGVLLGGFVAVQLLAVPEKTKADGATPPQVTAETKPIAKPVAETNGSASSGASVATADCDQQTWPYLSRTCMDEVRRKKGGPRVISTDKLDQPTVTAIESQPSAPPADTKPALVLPIKPAVAATAPPAVAVSTPPGDPAPVAAPAVAASTAEAVQPESKADTKAESNQKRQAKKTKRKPKPAVKPDPRDDEENRNVASSESDDEASADRRADRRRGKSGRIVERWTEREYDVDAEDGGRRRVTVIRRNRGGVFENLFGMGRDRDD